MAQKRMIDKKISVSDQVASLSIPAQLVYTWSFPHADDVGILPSSARTLKATIVPMWDMDIGTFEKVIEEIVAQGLWHTFEYGGLSFFRLMSFVRYQTLKRDRQPQTILPIAYFPDPKRTWKLLEEIGFQVENTGFQLEPEVKRSEVKRREEREDPAGSIKYLSQIPVEDMKEFVARFDITPAKVRSVAEDLKLYCERKGRMYRNYKSFLLNAIKRDHRERPQRPAEAVKEQEKPLTEEQKRKVEEMKRGIRDIAKSKTTKKQDE